MRRRVLQGAVSLGLFVATGCGVQLRQPGSGSEASGQGGPEPGRISVEQAFAKLQAGQAVLVDVRGRESFQAKRAAGAIVFPLDEIEQRPQAIAAQLPVGKQPILYCT
jgi:hypothetical protein